MLSHRLMSAVPIQSGSPAPSLPAQVVGLTATEASSTSCDLSWVAVSGATDYKVQYRRSGGFFTTFAHTPSTATSITVTGITLDVSYDFHVAAVNDAGVGPYSANATVSVGGGSTQTTQIGIDISLNGVRSANDCGTEYTRVVNAMGLTGVTKPLGDRCKFFGQDLSEAISHYNDAAGAGYTGIPVLCHNTDHPASTYNNRMDAITKPEIWIWHQEFEPVAASTMDIHYQLMDDARQAHPNGHLVSLCIDAGASAEGSNRQWDQLHPWNYHLDYAAMDTYCGGFKNPTQSQFNNLFSESLAWMAAIEARGGWDGYKGFACPEFGVAKMDSTGTLTQTERRDKITGLFDQLIANGWAWVNYWDEDNSNANYDWTIDDQDTVLAGVKPYITRN